MLFLAMRFAVVALRNFVQSIMLGYVVFYDIGKESLTFDRVFKIFVLATLIPEILCCSIMLAIVLFTFHQSRPLRMKVFWFLVLFFFFFFYSLRS